MLDRRQELVLYYRECDSVANNIIGGSEQRNRKESMSALRGGGGGGGAHPPPPPPPPKKKKPRRCCPVPVQSFGGAGRCREAGRTELPRASRMVAFHSVQRDHQEGEIDRAACRRLT
jgi:hypothetical protein